MPLRLLRGDVVRDWFGPCHHPLPFQRQYPFQYKALAVLFPTQCLVSQNSMEGFDSAVGIELELWQLSSRPL